MAMLRPGALVAVGREDALKLLAELGDVQGRLDDLKRRLRGLAEERQRPVRRNVLSGTTCSPQRQGRYPPVGLPAAPLGGTRRTRRRQRRIHFDHVGSHFMLAEVDGDRLSLCPVRQQHQHGVRTLPVPVDHSEASHWPHLL